MTQEQDSEFEGEIYEGVPDQDQHRSIEDTQDDAEVVIDDDLTVVSPGGSDEVFVAEAESGPADDAAVITGEGQ